LVVTGPGVGQVTLTWGPPQGPISDYSIVYSDDQNIQRWGVVSTGNITKYIISGLGTSKYYFWVKAVNGCMPGDFIGPVTISGTNTQITKPAVLGLSYTSGNQNNILTLAQLLGSLTMSFAGFRFLRRSR
jgi:hypothetical protein